MQNKQKMVLSVTTELKQLSPTEAAYLAGLIDGEGSLFIGKCKRNKAGNFSYTPTMVIVNTSPIIVDLCNIYGGHCQSQDFTSSWKKVYRWFLSQHLVWHYLPQIQPFLKIKVTQARVLLDAITLGKGTGHDRSEDDYEKLECYRQQLMKLNARGKRKNRND